MVSIAGERDYFSACYGKKRFKTYWEARKSSQKLNKHRDSARGNPYQCPSCHHYHVGNTNGRQRYKSVNRHMEKVRLRYGRV